MGLFGTPPETVEKNNTATRSAAPLIGVVVLVLLLLAPLLPVLFAVCAISGERRRIRLSRWLASCAVAHVVSLAFAGFSINRWLGWWQAAPAALWGGFIPETVTAPAVAGLRHAHTDTAPLVLWTHHLMVAGPAALALMCLWWWWRSYALALRGENEGEQYSNMRPIGWLDRRRAARNETAVRSGEWSHKHPGSIAVGIGHYGEVAVADIDAFKKATAVIGTSRSGKTRMANSLAAQQVVEFGCGNLTIDYKGGDDVARAKAEQAEKMGVPFLHFKLLSRTGGGYHPPHPYAPDRPAHYDPLQRGNGASKAAMLLGSVPREGDAAVYERKASEAVKLAYDIAALTGFDQHTTAEGHPVSGLSVLAQMLDPTMLVAQGKSVTVEQVRAAHPFLTEVSARAKVDNIKNRITTFEAELSRANSTLSGALEDVRSTVASYVNDSAAGPFLTPGTIPTLRIDLVRAILRNEIVLFSLPAQEYPEMASMIGTMVMLDLQNAVATLRDKRELVEKHQEQAGNTVVGGMDAAPWNPLIVQIEELGSVRSPAAAQAMLGLFNKSADVGIRPILSTQSLADIEAVDGTGVWLRQLTAQLDNLITFQLSEAHDAEKIASFSGMVDKKIATEHKDIQNNRTGLFQGADTVSNIVARTEERTRIGAGEALQLDRERGQFLWITKVPKLSAVHTTAPEGANNWSEKLTIAPVHEKPKDWNPFADQERIDASVERRNEVFGELLDDLRHNEMLFAVLDNSRQSVDIDQTVAQPTPAPTPTLPTPAEPQLADDALPTTGGDKGPEDPFDASLQAAPPASARRISDASDDDDEDFWDLSDSDHFDDSGF